MKNTAFVPALATKPADLETSWEIMEPLRSAGYQTGFMLVIRGGRKGVNGVERAEQCSNLKAYASRYADAPIVTMLSNMPIDEIDFLNEATTARLHVEEGIRFAAGLPIGGRKIVTFHLNTFTTPSGFAATPEAIWRQRFGLISSVLKGLSRIAMRYNVELKVETVPVPEFGDSQNAGSMEQYRGTRLADLRNPYYLTSSWGFNELREVGIGICLDLCHSRTIYGAAVAGDPARVLHPSDREGLKKTGRLLGDLDSLSSRDIVHLNDGRGMYLEGEESFDEGLALGRGTLPVDLAFARINRKGIPFVLEVWDSDFTVRDETKRSIEWILERS